MNKKRLISMALGVVMTMSTFTGALADEGGATGGDTGTTEKLGYVLNGTDAASGEGWTWSPEDAKLTLNDANVEAKDAYVFDIQAGKDTTVELNGSNSITIESNGNDLSTAIKADENVKFTGDGVLDVNTTGDFKEIIGIQGSKDVVFEGNSTVSLNLGNAEKGIRGIEAAGLTVGNADGTAVPELIISTYGVGATEQSYSIAANVTGKFSQLSGRTELSATDADEKSLGLQANDVVVNGGELQAKAGEIQSATGNKAAIKAVNPIVAELVKVVNSAETFESGVTTILIQDDASDFVKIRKVGKIELVYGANNGDDGTFNCVLDTNRKYFEIKAVGVVATVPNAGYKVKDSSGSTLFGDVLGSMTGDTVEFNVDFGYMTAGTYTVHAYVTDMNSNETEDSLTADYTVTVNKINYTGKTEITVPVAVNKNAEGTVDVADLLGEDIAEAVELQSPVKASGDGVLESLTVDSDNKLVWKAKTGEGNAADLTETYTIKAESGYCNDFTITVKFVSKDKKNVAITGLDAKNKVYDGKEYTPAGKLVATLGDGETATTVEVPEYEYEYFAVEETTGEDGTITKDYTPVSNAIGAGKYKVVVSVSKYNEEYMGSAEAEFEITKATMEVAPKAVSVTKGSTMPTFTLEYKGVVDADKEYIDNIINGYNLKAFKDTDEVIDTNTVGDYTITWADTADKDRLVEELKDFGFYDDYEVTVKDTATFNIYKRTSGGGGGGGSRVTSYTVNFNIPGETKVTSVKVNSGSTVKEPTAPTKEGYVFEGWYTDSKLTQRYNFDSKVTKSFTLYAKFTEKDHRIVLKVGDPQATLFGKTVTNDVAPVIKNDRTMLPARFVAEGLGATVEWDETAPGIVTITKGEIKIVIRIGEETAVVNGKEVKLDSPAFIENDRTYTPVRFVAENLGAKVEWQEGSNEVVIIEQ